MAYHFQQFSLDQAHTCASTANPATSVGDRQQQIREQINNTLPGYTVTSITLLLPACKAAAAAASSGGTASCGSLLLSASALTCCSVVHHTGKPLQLLQPRLTAALLLLL